MVILLFMVGQKYIKSVAAFCKNSKFGVMSLLQDVISLFFPRVCPGCGNLLYKNEEVLCIRCLANLPKTNFHNIRENAVEEIFWGRINLKHAVSYLYFAKDGLTQNIIHNLKYKGNTQIGVLMGTLYGQELLSSGIFNDLDVIIPVPLHWKKLKKRGFNQSEVFGKGLSSSLHVPQRSDLLVRKVNTATQTKKTRAERLDNVTGVFEITDKSYLENKHVLIVDDVITTGATIEATATTLLEIPGVRVSFASIGFAGH